MQNIAGVPVARQSALDKAKADAKAKKLRDEKEAASALEDFVKEFDADLSDEETQWQTGGTEGGILHTSTQGSGARIAHRGSRRHFTAIPRQIVNLQSYTLLMIG
jgi:membrane protein involved in colicin uptake